MMRLTGVTDCSVSKAPEVSAKPLFYLNMHVNSTEKDNGNVLYKAGIIFILQRGHWWIFAAEFRAKGGKVLLIDQVF